MAEVVDIDATAPGGREQDPAPMRKLAQRREDSYARSVGADVAALPLLNLDLPDATQGEREEDYNARAAASLNDVLNCDQQFVLMGGPDKIEVCDLLVRDRRLVHVKKRSGSSTLSHLWAQGTVSAELLLRDDEFRTRTRPLVAQLDASFRDVILADRALSNTYEIGYAVISSSPRRRTR